MFETNRMRDGRLWTLMVLKPGSEEAFDTTEETAFVNIPTVLFDRTV